MNNATLWAVVCVFVAVVSAAVALTFTGMETGAIIGLMTGLTVIVGSMVAIFDKLTTVHRVNAQQDEKLDIIEERVNGGLEPRIQAAVSAALDQRFGPVAVVEKEE